jgi:hypothetical protein
MADPGVWDDCDCWCHEFRAGEFVDDATGAVVGRFTLTPPAEGGDE